MRERHPEQEYVVLCSFMMASSGLIKPDEDGTDVIRRLDDAFALIGCNLNWDEYFKSGKKLYVVNAFAPIPMAFLLEPGFFVRKDKKPLRVPGVFELNSLVEVEHFFTV